MSEPQRGMTPREVAAFLRVGVKKVRAWIDSGQLRATNTATTSLHRQRFVVLPEDLKEFVSRRQAARAGPSRRASFRTASVDYFPD